MNLSSLISIVGISVLSTQAVAADCAPLLQHAFRPLAEKTDAAPLCDQYAGKVLLIVNTASKCGFTPQYEGLEALHADYAEKGLAVLGFPANDFMRQEPGTEAEIREFCTLTYGVKFPMFEKVQVTGDEATPLYKALAEAGGGPPKWNFHKYLVGRDGKVIAGYGSRVKPDDAELLAAIETALAAE